MKTADLSKLSRTEKEQLFKRLTPKSTEYIVHAPYPKQTAFMLLDCKEAFYGGAAGGGKSDALLMCALQYVDVPEYSAIIFRRTYADLIKPGALIDRALTWLAPWLQDRSVKWSDKEKKFTFPSGATLQFGYLETAKDRFNYQGGEYQFIGFDEVTHILEICYTYMFSRLRRLKGTDIPLRVRAASNPPDDGDNAEWVYDRFVNPETMDPARIFIPAGMDDNPHLDAESYVEALEELDPVTRARLRDGLWEIQRNGNMFKEEWFEFVDAPPPHGRFLRFWDCAATEVTPAQKSKGKKADFTASVKLMEKGGIYYVVDIVREQKGAMQVEEMQRRIAQQDGPSVRVREEKEPGASGEYAIVKKKQSIFAGYAYEGIRSTGSKIERANPLSAAAERGEIKILSGLRHADALIKELESFPAGVNDDLVDALAGAYSALSIMPKYQLPADAEGFNLTIETGSPWEDSYVSSVPDMSGSYWRN